MDVFDLQAKITLDSSGFESALSRSKEGLEGLVTKANLFAQAIHDIGIKAADVFGKVSESIVKVGSGFDTAMANVAAISGATGDDLDALRDKAKEMGATTKFSASEAADAFGYMAMAGWKTEDMLAGIDGIMNLAAASGEDLATTSDIVTDALTAFGLSAEDAGHFADVLAAASSNANTNVSMMGETFKYIAPLAGTLGYSAEDVAVAVGLMANSGIKAGQAGTSLRAALSSLLEPTEKTKDLMRDLGLIVTDTIQVLDNDKIATQQGKVASSTANLNKKQIAYNNAVAKYGAESSNAQKAMIDLEEAQRKAGVENDKLSKLMGGSTQVIDLYNAAVTDASGNSLSLSQTIDILRDTFENLTHTEQASAAAQLFGREAMSGMMAIINAAPADITKLESAVGDASGAAKSMAAIMQDNVGGAWDEFTSAVEGAQIAIYETFSDDLQDRILLAADGVSRLTAAFEEGGASGAMDEVVTMLSEMTGFDLSGIVDTFTGIGKAFADIKTAFEEGGVAGGFEAIVGQIESLTGFDLTGAVEGLSGISGIFSEIKAAFADGGIGGVFDDLVAGFESLTGIDLSAIGESFAGISEAFSGIGEVFSSDGLSGALDGLVASFESLTGIDLSGLKDGIGEFLSEVITVDDSTLTSIGGAVQSLADAFSGVDLSGIISGAATAVGDFFAAFDNVAETGISFVSEIVGQLSRDFEAMAPGIAGVAAGIGIFVGGLTAMQAFSGIPALLTTISTAFTTLNTVMAANPILLVVSILGALATALITAYHTNEDFRNSVDQLWSSIKEGASTAIENFKTTLDDIGGAISEAAGAIKEKVSEFIQAGRDLIQGLIDGITEKIAGIGTAVKDGAGKVVDWFNEKFDRHSPSKVFAEMGRDLMRGLEVGIDGEAPNVQRTIDGLRFKAPTIQTGRISAKDSMMGKTSAASISNAIALASGSGGNGQPVTINLVMDSRTMAQVLFDPLSGVAKQKGTPIGTW